jgi:hypothetical protein
MFEVTLTPHQGGEKARDPAAAVAHATSVGAGEVARMSIDKRFTGDLEATSTGEMRSTATGEPGCAAYVAIEWVRGSLR